MENIAFKRNPALTHEARFCTMLVRAVMVVDALLVIDRPFQILKNHGDARFIYDALKTVSDSYAESHILDYSWNAQRYEMSHDQKR
jgi:ABC-type molybdenum transport system ATPase subunit/photorepair protein PhrA